MRLSPGMHDTARVVAFVFIFLLATPLDVFAVTTFLTSGTTYNVPSDWNNSSNTVECIGSGGNGRQGAGGPGVGGSGGGGGAYASVSNLTLSGSVSYAVAAGGNFLTGTYFDGTSSTSASVSCQSGKSATLSIVGAGGTTAGSIGTTKYAGGNGATGGFCTSFETDGFGGGGGGAAGPSGAGASGSTPSAGAGFGGQGGNGSGGAGGSSDGASGSAGVEWTTAGSGGGGAGGDATIFSGGDGGAYGGGGGGGGGGSASDSCAGFLTGGSGAQGIIRITYTALVQRTMRLFGNVRLRGVRLSRY